MTRAWSQFLLREPAVACGRLERAADALVHVLGITASVAAAATLAILAFAYALPALSAASLGIYAAGMMAVFCCSAAYHLTREGRAKALLRRFDHAAIYVKIAGTYTPFALVKIGDTTGLILFGFMWGITALGATAKLLLPGRLVIMSYVLYLAQGWAVLAVWEPFSETVSVRVMALLAAGGILYTVGVVFHLWERLRFHNAIWHAMVLAASACHFAAIVDSVALGRAA
ncbi:MAG: hemolysin III family protein [Hyphomicrobiaceae bacterium]